MFILAFVTHTFYSTVDTLIKFFVIPEYGSRNGLKQAVFSRHHGFQDFSCNYISKIIFKSRACLQVWQKFHANLRQLFIFYSFPLKNNRKEPMFFRRELIHYNSLMDQAFTWSFTRIYHWIQYFLESFI